MGIRKAAILLSLFILLLAGCGKDGIVTAENETERSKQEIFIDSLLAGNYDELYEAATDRFKNNLEIDEFIARAEAFHDDVDAYSLVSEYEENSLLEYHWVDSSGEKGLRGYFNEDQTLDDLHLLPLTIADKNNSCESSEIYKLPVLGKWEIFMGGGIEGMQANLSAFELAKVNEEDARFDGAEDRNESYFSFGELVLAPMDGIVVEIVDTFSDELPGTVGDRNNPLGNYVVIEHENGEFSTLAHLMENSITVEVGEALYEGDILGQIGNSGNSREPHLHFQVSTDRNAASENTIPICVNEALSFVQRNNASDF